MLSPGITTAEVESHFLAAASARGLTSAFKGYRGFPRDITVSVNEEVINTLPSGRVLRARDIVKVQLALRHGFEAFAYQAWSFAVGTLADAENSLLVAAHTALQRAIQAAHAGRHSGEISYVIHESLASSGFWPSEHYTGHSIGTTMHGEPQVPCQSPFDIGVTPVLAAGTLLSIVVLAHTHSARIKRAPDGWNVLSEGGYPSALYSHLVLVEAGEVRLLTGSPTVLPRVA